MVEAGKRQKQEAPSSKTVRPSRVFSPFRVIGNVSNDTPFAVGTLGSTFYIVTSVGRLFQIYDAANLHLLFVSQQQTPQKITALATHFHYVYAAYGRGIGAYKRGRLVESFQIEDASKNISKLLVLGEYLVACDDDTIYVFKRPLDSLSKIPSELYTTISVINSKLDGEIVDLIHPATYLNKIIVATTKHLFIFNIRTGKLLLKTKEGMFGLESSISAIENAPVLDIIAVGSSQGTVYLYNLKKNKILMQIQASSNVSLSNSKITSISFRTDGAPHLVAALTSGDLFFYDLNKKSRVHVLKNAHLEQHGGVANAKFLNGQPVIVTNGADNQLKEYVFDPSLSTSNLLVVPPPRHLRSRGGHSSPPIAIDFPRSDKSHFILSASRDRSLWSFSLRKDAQSQELSQKAHSADKKNRGGQNMHEKFPEIVCIATSLAREDDWENILTGHKDETFARTWSGKNKRVGRHQFSTVDGGVVKSVNISHCGNFGLVGSSNGGIGSFNLQSGLLRKKYMLHKKAVTGLAIDGMNRKMVSTGLDGIVGFYNFSQLKFLGKLQLDAPITFMKYHKGSDLIACALDDLSIVIIDVITQKIIRVLYGHTNRITGFDFSSDGRWIVSVALDSTLRTWDLPTGGCIDGVRLPTVATCVKFSPIGDLIATTHVSGNGVFLWTNRAQFKPISTRHVEESEFSNILLPNASGEGGSTMIEGFLPDSVDEQEQHLQDEFEELDQIEETLVTLSSDPSRSKYKTLMNLETIKQRNKPKEAPKKPKQAPFFLSLTGELVGDRASVAEGVTPANGGGSGQDVEEMTASKLQKLKANGKYSFESEFTKLLRQAGESDEYKEFLLYLLELSPSSIELEIRSLNTLPPYKEMIAFIYAITSGLSSNTNYEMLQAVFSVFLKNHGDVLKSSESEELNNALEKWGEANDGKKEDMDSLVKYCSGVLNFLTTV